MKPAPPVTSARMALLLLRTIYRPTHQAVPLFPELFTYHLVDMGADFNEPGGGLYVRIPRVGDIHRNDFTDPSRVGGHDYYPGREECRFLDSVRDEDDCFAFLG